MMREENSASQLHDKATRGLPLSQMERGLLESWYAQQDYEESGLLTTDMPTTLVTLHQQVESTLEQLRTVTQRIQALTAENETLKQDVAILYRQLAQTKMAQSI